ncbi:LysR family transcriptional regulator [Enterovirga rhinocerotis]|uniref:DNA-binding transcriptional LysR family regulator n=1 Tax=Enterovirga rhinocerotis TaxID=1339210 RepID=A0A4R7C6S4_9HYPH|nr:LysR family transcriptional regulator [Enterovirga rhinocerotis]TDR94098.1 DNA-binding transcriptional LysR family regulator [Enterovirga rhinocerotis]
MSLTRYRYFAAVADLGSIREAADALRVAPSVVSRQIAALEVEYGAELFERQARGMRITPSGGAVLEAARAILASVQGAQLAIEDLNGIRRGHVRAWAVEGMIDDFLYPALAEFSAAYPEVTLEVMIASSDQLVQRLLDDEADVAVAFNPPDHRNLVSMAEIADPIVVAAHPEDRFAGRLSASLAELSQARFALPDRMFGIRHLIDDVADESGIKLRPAFVTNSIASLRAFARAGLGISVLTKFATQQDVADGRLVAIPMAERQLRMACNKVCVRGNRRLPPAVRALATHLARTARSLPRPAKRRR